MKKIIFLIILAVFSLVSLSWSGPTFHNPALYTYSPDLDQYPVDDPNDPDYQKNLDMRAAINNVTSVFNNLVPYQDHNGEWIYTEDFSDDERYSLYRKSIGNSPAPYSYVGTGANNESWDSLMLDSDLTLTGVLKVEEDGKTETGSGLPTGKTFNDIFQIEPDPINGVTQGYWQLAPTNSDGWSPKDWLWDLYDITPTEELNGEESQSLYFSIKAANNKANEGGGYQLFMMNEHWYANMLQAVTWSTLQGFLTTWGGGLDLGLGGHAISHISFWIGDTLPSVPEPATFMLMGFGMIGLAGIGRKRLKA